VENFKKDLRKWHEKTKTNIMPHINEELEVDPKDPEPPRGNSVLGLQEA